MKTPALLLTAALASLPFATHAQAPAPAAAAPTLAVTPRTVAPFPLIDAFFRICVLPATPDASRAAVQALGGKAAAMPQRFQGNGRHAEHFTLSLDGVGGDATFDASGLCMVGVEAAEPTPVLAMFDDAVGALGARVIAMTDRAPPPDATLERDVGLLFAPTDPFMQRLGVLSMAHPGRPTSMYLVHAIQGHDPASVEAVTPPDTTTPPEPPAPPPPADYVASEDLAGRANHAPEFPEEALHACESGTVRVRATVDATGAVQAVTVDRTSGHRDLDRAAVEAARTWTFRPGMANGVAIGGDVIVPVAFQDPCPAPAASGQ